MKKLDPLTQKLSKHFSVHPSRQKTLASMIFSALSTKNVHQQSLSLYVEGPNPKAALRKVERFFCEEALSHRDYAKAIADFLDFKKRGHLTKGR